MLPQYATHPERPAAQQERKVSERSASGLPAASASGHADPPGQNATRQPYLPKPGKRRLMHKSKLWIASPDQTRSPAKEQYLQLEQTGWRQHMARSGARPQAIWQWHRSEEQ